MTIRTRKSIRRERHLSELISCANPFNRQGFKSLANIKSPLKWTKTLYSKHLVL
jgi:hypothetical protein